MKNYRSHLVDAADSVAISASGGVCFVAKAGSSQKETLLNKDGSTLANPVALDNGKIEFWVGDDVTSVDLYIQCPGGQFVRRKGVKPSGPNDVLVNADALSQVMIIPFFHSDVAGDGLETASGFTEPANAVFTGIGTAVRVTTADATETISAGTSADPDGFVTAASVASAETLEENGALIIATSDYNAHVSTENNITWTLTAGADTAAGFIVLPYVLTD